MAIQMRRGNEVDFDAEKMLPGEWAVSTDAKYVRMCFAPGIVARMATYEAFEEDMAKIETILKNVQDVQKAVNLVQAEINGKSELVAENTALAEEYMKKAKEYAEQTSAFTGVQVAKKDLIGVVKGGDVHVEEDGSLRHFVKGAGQSFAIENTYEAPFADYKMFGKSVQETYEGNQLANLPDTDATEYNGITWSCKNGVVYAKGTAVEQSTSGNAKINYNVPVKAGTYYISSDIPDSEISANVRVTLSDGTKKYYENKSFTIDGTETEVRLYCAVSAGKTVDGFIRPMLNAGTEPLPYEPYVGGTASPNPEYPQPIVSVGEKLIDGVVTDVGIGNEICGKNLLNMSGAKGYADNGITVTINDDGSYSYVGTATSTAINVWMLGAYRGTSPILKLKANTPYYVQGCSLYETESPTLTITIISLEYGTSKVIILDTDRYVTGVRATAAVTGTTYNGTCYPMIVESDVAVEWEPYTDQSHTLNRTLRAIPVTDASLANYTDESGQMWCADTIEEVDGKMCLVERVWGEVFDGSDDERWIIESGPINTSGFRFYRGIYNAKTSDKTIGACSLNTHFQLGTAGQTWNTDNVYTINGETGVLYISKDTFTTLEEWKAWLAETPVTVQYILATPIITELTDEEISAIESMHSYNGATTVMSDAWTEVEAATSNVAAYVMSNKKEIETVVNELGTADISSIGDGTVKGAISEHDLKMYKWEDLSGVDLNQIKVPCFGYAYEATNRPTENNGYFECIPTNNSSSALCLQRYTPYGDITFTRQLLSDGTWEAWGVDYLPLTGGTLSGILRLNPVDNGASEFYKNANASVDYGTIILDRSAYGKMAGLEISANENRVRFRDSDNVYHNLFGAHNKPSGSYTGNGSATIREINVGGITNEASVLVVSRTDIVSFVTYAGAFAMNINGEFFYYKASEVQFKNGVYSIVTSSGTFNGNGNAYRYQLL